MNKPIVWLLVFFIFFFILAWQRFYTLKLTILLDNDESKYREKCNRMRKLELQRDEYKSIKRLENFAVETLNMKYPDGRDYVSGSNN